MKNCDVIVVGGGIVGLMFAAHLSFFSEDLDICVIQGEVPDLNWSKETLPDRVSALNHASQRLFEALGLWELVLKEAAPYFHMCVWDKRSQVEMAFDRDDIHAPDLGHIVTNRILQKVLWAYLSLRPQVTLETGYLPTALQVTPDQVLLQLPEKVICGRLLVGADGADSWVHRTIGLERYERDYHHSALIAWVQTENAHNHTAFQSFSSEEILAFLPLQHAYQSSIVWSAPPERVRQLSQQPAQVLNASLTQAIEYKLGRVLRTEKISTFPLKMRHSKSYIKERIALIGDAIHTLHPLAGQGLNLGLLDAMCLSDSIQAAHAQRRDIGQWPVLRRYERFRVGDNWKMILMVGALKKLFCNDSKWLLPFRTFGMKQVHQQAWMKGYFIRQALGE